MGKCTEKSRSKLKPGALRCGVMLLSMLAAACVLPGGANRLLLKPANAASQSDSCVVLLHGLARTSSSMNDLRDVLDDAGFKVVNVDYPSREFPIEKLALMAVPEGLEECRTLGASSIHFVTHSMGGILVRQYLNHNPIDELGRVVMLAPPNNGSEVIDELRDAPGFKWLNGPAGQQMGTDVNSVPVLLGPTTADVAVIAGTTSINLILSTYLPDPDDGKVSVQSTRLDGMCAMLEVPASHTFIMEDADVMSEVVTYLLTGNFVAATAEYLDCPAKEGS